MSLIKEYEAAIAGGNIVEDPSQRAALNRMQNLLDSINAQSDSWLSWLYKKSMYGFYLYGPVGVGKTFLMDLFYAQVNKKQKARFHFHHFMQQIDAQLRRSQGKKDPLRHIAAELAKKVRLLCFDEFLVNDVAHAMILAELLQALFKQGIVLGVTSNTSPENLYLNGIHRERFIPAIKLIQANCQVLAINYKKDYRLGRMPLLEAYLYPLNAETTEKLIKQFAQISPNAQEKGTLMVQNREISFIKCGQRAVWFDFKIICNLPRSQLDYLEIADRFDTIFLSNIPALTSQDTVFAILLIHFIDVLYDRGIRLIISAAVPVELIYIEGEMRKEFQRTLSRLQEMQAADYLNRHPWRHEEHLLDTL